MNQKATYSLLIAFILLVVISTSYIYLNNETKKINSARTYEAIAELRPYWSNVRILINEVAADAAMDTKWDEMSGIGDCTIPTVVNEVNISTKFQELYAEVFDYLDEKDDISCEISNYSLKEVAPDDDFQVNFEITCTKTYGDILFSYKNSAEVWKTVLTTDVSIAEENRCDITVTDNITGKAFTDQKMLP